MTRIRRQSLHRNTLPVAFNASPVTTSGPVEGPYAKLASVSQILMLVLVGFGYWYTVLPVYQKSLLDEDIARKTIELNAATAELATLRTGIRAKESELVSLQRSIDGYRSDTRQARSEASKAKLDSVIANQHAAEKYSSLRSQSISLFWGEILQQCVGESISDDAKLIHCIEARAKISHSFLQLEPDDGVKVLQRIRDSVSRHRDTWNQIVLTHAETYRALTAKKSDIELTGQKLKAKPKATTSEAINESISATYENDIALIRANSDISKLWFQQLRDKEKVLRQMLNISV